MTPLLRKLVGMNWWLVIVMGGLLTFGVYSIESAARHLPEGGEYYADMQKRWIIIGTVIYLVSSLLDYRWFKWLALPMYVISLGLCATMLDSDADVHQTSIAGLNFQPTQMLIASGILMLAWLLQDLPNLGKKIPKVGWLLEGALAKLLVVGLITGVPFLVVMRMGDTGSALVWIPLALVSLIACGLPFRHLYFICALGVAAIPPLYFVVLPQVSERGTERIELFLDMLEDRPVDISGNAWAPYNIGIAIGHAGWNGTGHNAQIDTGSMHARRMIPYRTAHNDFIFAVIAEEQGFKGALLLIIVSGVLLVLCLFVATHARDMMGLMLVTGVVALFFAHIFESIGMCIQLMPITGIPLPLISYSGTFVVISMFLLGLVQSVWVHRRREILIDELPQKNKPKTSGLFIPEAVR